VVSLSCSTARDDNELIALDALKRLRNRTRLSVMRQLLIPPNEREAKLREESVCRPSARMPSGGELLL
jgi:hypothetical protein